MSDPDRHLRCAHLVFIKDERGRPAPADFCACPAGLVHVHDCPVATGRECVHFRERGAESEAEPVAEARWEEQHTALMADFLTLGYRHRVRSLDPAGDPWAERRRDLEEQYARAERDRPDEPVVPEGVLSEEAYEKEKERLIGLRREREQVREQRRLDSQERARRGIKTVVERAQETVATHGNVATSYLDDVELPPEERERRRRRRRRRRPASGDGGEGKTPRKTGKRPAAKKAKRAGPKTGARKGGGKPGSAAKETSGGGKEGKAPRRRRRRRGGKGRPGPSSA